MSVSAIRVRMEKELSDELYSIIDGPIVEFLMEAGKLEGNKDFVKMLHQGSALPLTRAMTPDLYDLCHSIKDTLCIEDEIDFYIVNSPEINAYAVLSREKDRPHTVALHSGLIERFTTDELKFIIGHELGHLVSGKVKLDDIINFLMPPDMQKDFPIGFLQKYRLWLNLTELTADRYGYMASKNINVIANCFFKMTSGLNTTDVSFSPEAFLKENDTAFRYFQEAGCPLMLSHPVNPLRIRAMEIFAKSELIQKMQEHPDSSFDDKELHEKMEDEIISIMLNLFENNLDQHYTNFMIVGGLLIAEADGEMTDIEIEEIVKSVSPFLFFPREYINSIMKDSNSLLEILKTSIEQILLEAPEFAPRLIEYLVGIVLADNHCTKEELMCVLNVATRDIGMSEKEAIRIIGNAVRQKFIPNV